MTSLKTVKGAWNQEIIIIQQDNTGHTVYEFNKVRAGKNTVFTRIGAAALISFFAPQVRRLFEGGAYLNIVPDKFPFSIFLFNGTLSIC